MNTDKKRHERRLKRDNTQATWEGAKQSTYRGAKPVLFREEQDRATKDAHFKDVAMVPVKKPVKIGKKQAPFAGKRGSHVPTAMFSRIRSLEEHVTYKRYREDTMCLLFRVLMSYELRSSSGKFDNKANPKTSPIWLHFLKALRNLHMSVFDIHAVNVGKPETYTKASIDEMRTNASHFPGDTDSIVLSLRRYVPHSLLKADRLRRQKEKVIPVPWPEEEQRAFDIAASTFGVEAFRTVDEPTDRSRLPKSKSNGRRAYSKKKYLDHILALDTDDHHEVASQLNGQNGTARGTCYVKKVNMPKACVHGLDCRQCTHYHLKRTKNAKSGEAKKMHPAEKRKVESKKLHLCITTLCPEKTEHYHPDGSCRGCGDFDCYGFSDKIRDTRLVQYTYDVIAETGTTQTVDDLIREGMEEFQTGEDYGPKVEAISNVRVAAAPSVDCIAGFTFNSFGTCVPCVPKTEDEVLVDLLNRYDLGQSDSGSNELETVVGDNDTLTSETRDVDLQSVDESVVSPFMQADDEVVIDFSTQYSIFAADIDKNGVDCDDAKLICAPPAENSLPVSQTPNVAETKSDDAPVHSSTSSDDGVIEAVGGGLSCVPLTPPVPEPLSVPLVDISEWKVGYEPTKEMVEIYIGGPIVDKSWMTYFFGKGKCTFRDYQQTLTHRKYFGILGAFVSLTEEDYVLAGFTASRRLPVHRQLVDVLRTYMDVEGLVRTEFDNITGKYTVRFLAHTEGACSKKLKADYPLMWQYYTTEGEHERMDIMHNSLIRAYQRIVKSSLVTLRSKPGDVKKVSPHSLLVGNGKAQSIYPSSKLGSSRA